MKGVGHAPGGPPGVPRSMSLNVPYHKEQEYIWFREGILNPKVNYYAFSLFQIQMPMRPNLTLA